MKARLGEIGARLRQRALRLIERILERPLVDREQKIAGLHDLAVLEMHLFEIARDVGAQLDQVDREEAADIFVHVDDLALHGLRHCDLRPRRSLRAAVAATREREEKNNDRGDARRERDMNHAKPNGGEVLAHISHLRNPVQRGPLQIS